jgi:multidrug efflux system membrane fusion protein
MSTLSDTRRRLYIALAVLLGASGCLYYVSLGSAQHAQANSEAPQHPSVDVIIASPTAIRTWDSFSGRLEAVAHVQVRPRVGGTITQVLFEDGAIVEKNAPLFVIDPRPYEADLESAKAALASALSQLTLAKRELERAKKLVKSSHISQSTVDTRESEYRVAVAAVNAAKARQKNAALNLEYAHINAPVAGRVSRAEITVGNVIEAGPQAPVLTSIVSNDTLYAEFDVDEQTYLRAIRGARDSNMPVEMSLPADEATIYRGHVHSFDNQINPNTGTIRARALFHNKDGALVPGMFANVRIGSSHVEEHIVVPERAIGTDQNRKFLLLLDEDNTVIYREVSLGKKAEGARIIAQGLQPGERVIVNGLQRVRPGAKASPVLLSSESMPDAISASEKSPLHPVDKS